MNPTLDEQRLALRKHPGLKPVMFQNWRRLLFLHWKVSASEIQQTLPKGLFVDTFDGSAWVGLVPFFMRNIRLRGLPPIPGTANFMELNIRTYVYDSSGRPGVWFYSLDANCWPVVKVARWWFHLPYHWARMSSTLHSTTEQVDYRCHRRGTPSHQAARFVYAPQGPVQQAVPGSLEFFLLERYVLFAEKGPGQLFFGQVAHSPYPFQNVALSMGDNHLVQQAGIHCSSGPPAHCAYSPGVDVEIFSLQPLRNDPPCPGLKCSGPGHPSVDE